MAKHQGNCAGCEVRRGDLKKVGEELYCALCNPETPLEKRIRAVKDLRGRVRSLSEESVLWEHRFEALAQGRDEEEVQQAFYVAPSEGRSSLLRYFDPLARNFLGSGMSLQEWSMKMSIDDASSSYLHQKRPERKRRLDLILRLAVALEEIKRVNRFGTALGEGAIESVLLGRFSDVRPEFFTYDEEIEAAQEHKDEAHERRMREIKELWAPFRELLHEALGPQAEPPELADSAGANVMMGLGGWKKFEEGWYRGTAKPRTQEFDYSRNFVDHKVLLQLFEYGIRWVQSEDGPGYWCKLDRSLFQEKEEEHFDPVFRFYKIRELLDWWRRNVPEESPE